MSRSFDEKILWYFYKRASSSVLFLLILTAAFISVGYAKEESRIFFILGFFLLAIAVWQMIRASLSDIGGEEVDSSAQHFMNNINLEQDFIYAFSMGRAEYDNLRKIILHGYCCFGIETEPLYRWDSEEGIARSSNYQVTCFGLDRDTVFIYTEIKSLVDSEYCDQSRIFKISGIESAEISKISRSCAVSAKKNSERVTEDFDALIIYLQNGEKYAFAVGKEQMEEAVCIRDFILERKQKAGRLRKPVLKVSAERAVEECCSYSRKEKAAAVIGLIGDKMRDLEK